MEAGVRAERLLLVIPAKAGIGKVKADIRESPAYKHRHNSGRRTLRGLAMKGQGCGVERLNREASKTLSFLCRLLQAGGHSGEGRNPRINNDRARQRKTQTIRAKISVCLCVLWCYFDFFFPAARGCG